MSAVNLKMLFKLLAINVKPYFKIEPNLSLKSNKLITIKIYNKLINTCQIRQQT